MLSKLDVFDIKGSMDYKFTNVYRKLPRSLVLPTGKPTLFRESLKRPALFLTLLIVARSRLTWSWLMPAQPSMT